MRVYVFLGHRRARRPFAQQVLVFLMCDGYEMARVPHASFHMMFRSEEGQYVFNSVWQVGKTLLLAGARVVRVAPLPAHSWSLAPPHDAEVASPFADALEAVSLFPEVYSRPRVRAQEVDPRLAALEERPAKAKKATDRKPKSGGIKAYVAVPDLPEPPAPPMPPPAAPPAVDVPGQGQLPHMYEEIREDDFETSASDQSDGVDAPPDRDLAARPPQVGGASSSRDPAPPPLPRTDGEAAEQDSSIPSRSGSPSSASSSSASSSSVDTPPPRSPSGHRRKGRRKRLRVGAPVDRPTLQHDVEGSFIRLTQDEELGYFDLTATCSLHPNCKLTRTIREGDRAAVGRPLAYLWAWLGRGCKHGSQKTHLKDKKSKEFHVRYVARVELMDMSESVPFLAAERQPYPGEDIEPEQCP